jgi:hypothetical protein
MFSTQKLGSINNSLLTHACGWITSPVVVLCWGGNPGGFTLVLWLRGDACRSASGPLTVDWDAAELCLDLLLVVLLRNRDRLPLLWPPVFDHLASIIRGKGVSHAVLCCVWLALLCCAVLCCAVPCCTVLCLSPPYSASLESHRKSCIVKLAVASTHTSQAASSML